MTSASTARSIGVGGIAAAPSGAGIGSSAGDRVIDDKGFDARAGARIRFREASPEGPIRMEHPFSCRQ